MTPVSCRRPPLRCAGCRRPRGTTPVTDEVAFPCRSGWTCADAGWEQVTEAALDWALAHAR